MTQDDEIFLTPINWRTLEGKRSPHPVTKIDKETEFSAAGFVNVCKCLLTM